MGKEYSWLIFIYQYWNGIIYIILLVFFGSKVLRKIVIHRKIVHKKELVMVLAMTILLNGSFVLFLLEPMGITHMDLHVSLMLILYGFSGICCGYLVKYQEEFAKMGRKKLFINTLSSKELFIMGKIVIFLGICSGVVLCLFY